MGLKRKHLSVDALLQTVRESIAKENLQELKNSTYSWQDCIIASRVAWLFLGFSVLHCYSLKKKKLRRLFRLMARGNFPLRKCIAKTAV